MLFKDEVNIEVRAGKGGDGAATFRREKYIPKGGPDGGDGGDGGNVIIRVNPHMRTLSHIHNNQKFHAQDGQNGMGSKKYGKYGESIVVEVPAGTTVLDAESNVVYADLVESHQECIIAKGGRGGRGNVWFKSSTNQAPFYAEKGKKGEERSLLLELKMIAHVGLVGYPNAGKSTLVSKITNARPKIGNYPFTTLKPNIGVMTIDDAYTSILIADIPGLIEGAHLGKGLGIDFLKHIERTKIILYVLDAFDKPLEKLQVLMEELRCYSEILYRRPFMIALNKMDLIYEESEKLEILDGLNPITQNTVPISAINGMGLAELKQKLYIQYAETEKTEQENESDEIEDSKP